MAPTAIISPIDRVGATLRPMRLGKRYFTRLIRLPPYRSSRSFGGVFLIPFLFPLFLSSRSFFFFFLFPFLFPLLLSSSRFLYFQPLRPRPPLRPAARAR